MSFPSACTVFFMSLLTNRFLLIWFETFLIDSSLILITSFSFLQPTALKKPINLTHPTILTPRHWLLWTGVSVKCPPVPVCKLIIHDVIQFTTFRSTHDNGSPEHTSFLPQMWQILCLCGASHSNISSVSSLKARSDKPDTLCLVTSSHHQQHLYSVAFMT